MKLAQIQAALFALTSGEREPPSELPDFIGGPEEVPLRRRVQVYADAVRFKTAHALGVPFPKVAALLGEARFLELVVQHMTSCPRARRTVLNLMEDLPTYLAQDAVRWGRSDLGDLALLERVRHELSAEVGAETVGPETLAGLDDRGWATAILRFIPALRVVRVGFDVTAVWECVDRKVEPPPPRAAPVTLLVWRKGPQVFHSVLEEPETRALERALGGAALSEVCDAFAGQEAAGDQAYAALHGWLSDGLVASVTTPSDEAE
jgi:hypothetical protein